MKIKYIKANGEYFWPQEKGVQDPKKIPGCFKPVCYIKKLWFGRWQIDLHDDYFSSHWNNQIPNARLVLYPAGIQEIKWEKESNDFI